ncbi:hypothetical protein BJ138DRAFT_1146165 [Hygrophoropsis aurantiaca]|uniref:Uncharacterized protein n=1 Tax=Hygrophoropsis aurantiaca TaxID=72124 RepID=A0ACB8AJ90_9AGAM|nr:hypothetical protein BJ138DRAFT_1146165 [Hygrophoropsis aurantiaca]
MSKDQGEENTSSDRPHQPTYVYPVRYLLTGPIQPATHTHVSRTEIDEPTGSGPSSRGVEEAAIVGDNSPPHETESSHSQSSCMVEIYSIAETPVTTLAHELNTSLSNLSEVLRESTGDDETTSITARVTADHTPEDVAATPGYIAGPVGEPILARASTPDSADEHTRNHNPVQLSEAAAAAFSDKISFTTQGDAENVPRNPSAIGIVHLPPLPASPELGLKYRHSSSGSSAVNSWVSQQAISLDKGTGPSADLGARTTPGDVSSSTPSSIPGLPHGSSALSSPDETFVTMRYEHVEDENGHHVLTGREGKLTKCEDEPIRTPGAVQGFGVLIALEEDADQGTLIVRQVSENAGEILGLSPKFLFSLECFTDTLPEAQADLLWDNIEFLNEPSISADGQEENPHVFLLSGFGEPGSAEPGDNRASGSRRSWTCWCAVHRPPSMTPREKDISNIQFNSIIMEFELERDTINPLYPIEIATTVSPGSKSGSDSTPDSSETLVAASAGMATTVADGSISSKISATSSVPSPPSDSNELGDGSPSTEDILASTTNHAKPIPALERLRRMSSSMTTPATPRETGRLRRKGGCRSTGTAGVGMMDIFAVMAQINEQLGAAADLDTCLKVAVGIIKDLTQFHRVLVYQFDDVWNGQVVAELLDWSRSHDLYHGLHFPASDIPAQARELYTLNTVRILYNRTQPTARIVVRNKSDLETPLNMTHSYLRAMSPIHLKYLENMEVRASLSVSIVAFGSLWGLITCHSYGQHGMRVSFPVRQMLRLLSQTISRNVERLNYARRLQTRKLINPVVPGNTGDYIVSNTDELLTLFDADHGILVIGESAKILGPDLHGQEILVMAEYLRLKQFNTIQVSQAVVKDFPDLQLSTGLEIIAGLLYVPLSSGGKDFIAMLRKGQPRNVKWAGRPTKGPSGSLEPRKSFKMWTETVAGSSRAWTQEEIETAGVLSLVYGKFIEVWRQKESVKRATTLTNILLSNASHEVRTPLNHIINYLEMAMNGPLDGETRDNLSRSHAASKNLLFTINDLLDLTRLESGKATYLNEPFNLRSAIEDSVQIYRNEAVRRNIAFHISVSEGPRGVVGDITKIKTVVANLTANALKYTKEGSVSVQSRIYDEPEGLRKPSQAAVEIIVADTGCGIPGDKLESIFREFEQVESSETKNAAIPGVGLGLALVARIVEQLGGQLRVESQMGLGSRFSFLIPLELSHAGSESGASNSSVHTPSIRLQSGGSSRNSARLQIQVLPEDMAETCTSQPMVQTPKAVEGKGFPPTLLFSQDSPPETPQVPSSSHLPATPCPAESVHEALTSLPKNLRVLIVEDNDINRKLLVKRLQRDGHVVEWATNGQEGLEMIESDRDFDCVLMDIQMPILNGFEATERIRDLEKVTSFRPPMSRRKSHELNGRLPIFAVSASLFEQQRGEITNHGIDGWILKPIDFARLKEILRGVVDPIQRNSDVYRPGCNWEFGGWFVKAPSQ